ncbi:MAG: DUF4124 domain-containing protein [Sideroxydans sp.]|nr:DUF4124 domain-containing protein [Sideroxydans sp.]
MKRYFSVIALFAFSLTAHAGLNKWVDADGKVHYSDAPPPENVKAESVRNIAGKGQTEAPATFSPKSIAEREAELKKSKQTKEEAAAKKAQQDAEVAVKKQNCTASQQNLRLLEEGMRIVTYDEKGEKTYLDDAAREQQINEVRKNIRTYCN